jgi:hypothetical protein
MAAVFVTGFLLAPSTLAPFQIAGLVVLVGWALLLEVELPWGGSVSLGHAVVIAFAALLAVPDFLVVVGLGLLLVALPELRRYGIRRGLPLMLVLTCGAGAALAGRVAGNALVATWAPGHRISALMPVMLAGVAYLVVVLALQMLMPLVGGRPKGWKTAVNVYASLLCAASLLALASAKSWGLGAVALVPLLVLRFSFHRYFEARRTYLQATQALSMIPEVAGLTPLGHGERTATYASALSGWMQFSPEEIDQAATVARLHHIGQIAHPDLLQHPYGPYPEERRMISEASADILSETGFLNDVARIVAAVHGNEPWQVTPVEAVVRVSSTLDDLVGEDPSRLADAVVGLLARHDTGLERTVALRLAQLCDAQPEIAERAIAAGASLAMAGAGLGADVHGGH